MAWQCGHAGIGARVWGSVGISRVYRISLRSSHYPLAYGECAGLPQPGWNHVQYAKTYALAAGAAPPADRESLEARAVFRLEKARDSGYFRASPHLDRVEADPASARIRSRRDYCEALHPDSPRPPGGTGTTPE